MTYENAYEILSEVRRGINEYSTAYVQDTDTTGAYSNTDILKKINDAQGFIYNLLLSRSPDVFYKSAALTGVASVYTPPSDFFRLIRVEDSAGRTLRQINLDDKKLAADAGTGIYFYQFGKTFTLDKLTATDVLTFYYIARCRNLDVGKSSAGGSLSITLATTARPVADYYNGMQLENITKAWVTTISDYSAARVVTLAAETAAASDYYGLISELPEDFHYLIGLKATLLMKETYKSLNPPTVEEVAAFNEILTARLIAYFGPGVTSEANAAVPGIKPLSQSTGTYFNAYAILSNVRQAIGDYSITKVQGLDSTGQYDNLEIMRRINDAQKYLFDLLVNRQPQQFYKSVSLTASSNALTPPADFYRIRRLENSEGQPLTSIHLNDKMVGGEYGNPFGYYWFGNTIVIDTDTSGTYTLYYVSRPRELTQGMSSAGGSLSLTLATTARKIVDYYNGMTIENITANWVDTISDYATTLVATLAAQTGAASQYYGLISELPEVFHPFIIRKATILMRAAYKSLEPPTATDMQFFADDLAETLKSYFGTTNTDQEIGELFR